MNTLSTPMVDDSIGEEHIKVLDLMFKLAGVPSAEIHNRKHTIKIDLNNVRVVVGKLTKEVSSYKVANTGDDELRQVTEIIDAWLIKLKET